MHDARIGYGWNGVECLLVGVCPRALIYAFMLESRQVLSDEVSEERAAQPPQGGLRVRRRTHFQEPCWRR